VEKAIKNDQINDCTSNPPCAPRICGKKLVAKVIEDEIFND
jgi:hypothetical protein